jgi:hypothetical protein
VRDLDSELFEREVHAVHEWLFNTSYAFHMMRDNAQHGIPMLGGLWGLALNRLSKASQIQIVNALLSSDNLHDIQMFVKTYSERGDQQFLTDHVWPLARHNSISHDSFYCLWYRYFYLADTRPFPTQRQHPNCFVGCPQPCCKTVNKNDTDLSQYEQCASACRPNGHRDWLFC